MTKFHKTALLALFFLEHPDGDPDLEDLLEFDDELDRDFDQLLVREMTLAEIEPINRRTKSRVLLLGSLSGMRTRIDKVTIGCTMFRNAWPLLPDEEEIL